MNMNMLCVRYGSYYDTFRYVPRYICENRTLLTQLKQIGSLGGSRAENRHYEANIDDLARVISAVDLADIGTMGH